MKNEKRNGPRACVLGVIPSAGVAACASGFPSEPADVWQILLLCYSNNSSPFLFHFLPFFSHFFVFSRCLRDADNHGWANAVQPPPRSISRAWNLIGPAVVALELVAPTFVPLRQLERHSIASFVTLNRRCALKLSPFSLLLSPAKMHPATPPPTSSLRFFRLCVLKWRGGEGEVGFGATPQTFF